MWTQMFELTAFYALVLHALLQCHILSLVYTKFKVILRKSLYILKNMKWVIGKSEQKLTMKCCEFHTATFSHGARHVHLISFQS